MNFETELEWVDWLPTGANQADDEIPYATHYGILRLGNEEIRVYRLNTGETVIHHDDFLKFLGVLA